MKVKLLVHMVGDSHQWEVGEEVDLPEAEATRMVDAGVAEYATATRAKRETRVRKPKES